MWAPYSLYGLIIQIFTLMYSQETEGVKPLDSLHCVNNFKTHWICHWKQMSKVQEMFPMSLYHWSNLDSSRHRCHPVEYRYQEDGNVYMSCRFTAIFSSTIQTSFAFLPESDVHVQTCIIPASKVRMTPPKDLKVQMSAAGEIRLTWKMPENVHSSASLLYQVMYYRKDWETWEDAVLLNILGKTEVVFSSRSFVPESTYLFRVRSMPHEDPAGHSAWSKQLTWAMPADHRGIIQNLNCEYDGSMEMRCSWEVRKELTNSVSFILYYTEPPADCGDIKGDKSCLGKINVSKDSLPYVQYSCTLKVSSHQAMHFIGIQVRMVEEVKDFKASLYIKTEPPTDLQIKDQSGMNGYTLKWSPPKVDFPTLQFIYQLCYWKQGDPECPDSSLVSVSGNLPEYYIPASKLEGSTNYTAKVRVKPDEKSGYNGSWSVWSQSSSWKTTMVLTIEVICVSTFGISIVFSLFAFFAFRYYKRLKKRLKDSLPNPSKSKLLSSNSPGYWKQSLYPFIHQDLYAEEEKPSICVPSSPVAPPSTPESEKESVTDKAPDPGVCPLGPYSLPPPAEEKIKPDQSKCDTLVTDEKSNRTPMPPSEATNGLSKKSHYGPYMMFTGAQSMSNLVPSEAKRPGYFSLPSCQAELFKVPKDAPRSCRPPSSGDPMGYVLKMEKPVSVQPEQNPDKKSVPDNKYFAIPAPCDFQVSPEGPVMIINPDGSAPLLLKQVGDYCFFPGLHGSQENLERKTKAAIEQNQQKVAEDQSLPAVQAFKVMQRGYFALPHT